MATKELGRCVIISGSPDVNIDFIKSNLKSDDYIICADRGYLYAKQCCVKPDLFVGDFDSFSGSVDEGVELVSLKVHKDDTDTMHCVTVALEKGFKDILILGAIGGRFDHSFANVSILQYISDNNAYGKIVTENETIEFRSSGVYNYINLKDHTFSVFPFGCSEIVVSYSGDVEYPAKSLKVTSSVAMAISNIFNSDNVQIAIEKGSALVIVDNC
jgi:thiamine pyrophosphokinase